MRPGQNRPAAGHEAAAFPIELAGSEVKRVELRCAGPVGVTRAQAPLALWIGAARIPMW